jgi:hypothetical protein
MKTTPDIFGFSSPILSLANGWFSLLQAISGVHFASLHLVKMISHSYFHFVDQRKPECPDQVNHPRIPSNNLGKCDGPEQTHSSQVINNEEYAIIGNLLTVFGGHLNSHLLSIDNQLVTKTTSRANAPNRGQIQGKSEGQKRLSGRYSSLAILYV